MRTSVFIAVVVCCAGTRLVVGAEADRHVLVVVGAPGTDEYAKQFELWASRWEESAALASSQFASVGRDAKEDLNDRDILRSQIRQIVQQKPAELWLVLIGHGTFDGQTAKFNLKGPDVSAQELADWLSEFEGSTVVANCSSASGPFINSLSGPNRIVVTATKSGHEHNFARFGDHLSAAIGNQQLDLDKDGQTSVLEAFLGASAATQEFYDSQQRLSTEHALIDDNGDGKGTPNDWFQGIRVDRTAKDGSAPDGFRANQIVLVRSESEAKLTPEQVNRRNELEQRLESLRQQKSAMTTDQYYDQLGEVLIEIAKLYQAAEDN